MTCGDHTPRAGVGAGASGLHSAPPHCLAPHVFGRRCPRTGVWPLCRGCLGVTEPACPSSDSSAPLFLTETWSPPQRTLPSRLSGLTSDPPFPPRPCQEEMPPRVRPGAHHVRPIRASLHGPSCCGPHFTGGEAEVCVGSVSGPGESRQEAVPRRPLPQQLPPPRGPRWWRPPAVTRAAVGHHAPAPRVAARPVSAAGLSAAESAKSGCWPPVPAPPG